MSQKLVKQPQNKTGDGEDFIQLLNHRSKTDLARIEVTGSSSPLFQAQMIYYSFAEANRFLNILAARVPAGGSFATRFVISWVDGKQYEDSIDLLPEHFATYFLIEKHLLACIKSVTGLEIPDNITAAVNCQGCPDMSPGKWFDLLKRYYFLHPDDYDQLHYW